MIFVVKLSNFDTCGQQTSTAFRIRQLHINCTRYQVTAKVAFKTNKKTLTSILPPTPPPTPSSNYAKRICSRFPPFNRLIFFWNGKACNTSYNTASPFTLGLRFLCCCCCFLIISQHFKNQGTCHDFRLSACSVFLNESTVHIPFRPLKLNIIWDLQSYHKRSSRRAFVSLCGLKMHRHFLCLRKHFWQGR